MYSEVFLTHANADARILLLFTYHFKPRLSKDYFLIDFVFIRIFTIKRILRCVNNAVLGTFIRRLYKNMHHKTNQKNIASFTEPIAK